MSFVAGHFGAWTQRLSGAAGGVAGGVAPATPTRPAPGVAAQRIGAGAFAPGHARALIFAAGAAPGAAGFTGVLRFRTGGGA